MTVIERMTVVACTLALAAAGVSRAAAPELSVKKTATDLGDTPSGRP
jgi:hypothetical protein